MTTPRARTIVCVLLMTVAASLAFAGAAAAQNDNNRGTVKIHDEIDADPDQRNQPHVSCDFWVEGFNFKDSSGHLTFKSWPPTGDKSVVVPDGDDLAWSGTPDGDGEYDFLKGAYELPPGHYQLRVYTHDDHPGHNAGHFAKSKMFWVDECEQPPCVDDPETEIDECDENPCVDDPETEVDECAVIPFFPGFTSLALGSLGALGAVGYILRRRS